MSEFAVPAEAAQALDAAMAADGFADSGTPVLPQTPADGFHPGNDAPSTLANWQPKSAQGDPEATAAAAEGETQTPQVATPPAGDPAPVAPEGGAGEGDSFAERFDPSSLPPELLPAYKLMQADYTRKQQANAEARRLAEQYQGVDLDAAVQLFQGIQDPQGLIAFVQQASEHLADQGLVEWDDGSGYGDPADGQQQDNLSEALQSLAAGDPELAPLAEAVQQMQARLDNFQTEQSQRLAAEREQTIYLQAMGEVQRMENVIRTDNPQYSDADIDAIYEIASYHDGDLLAAQQSYEAHFARRLGSYMQQKQAAPNAVVPTGLPTPVSQPELSFDPLDPKQAHAAALETLRLIESQGD